MNQTVVSPLGVTKKSILSRISSFGKEEWAQTEGGGDTIDFLDSPFKILLTII